VRTAVFVQEQGMAPGTQSDDVDRHALHAVVCNALGYAVATGRLSGLDSGFARIGRMAVHRALRGSGVGRVLLQTLMDAARQRGHAEVSLHAQRSAEGFYQRQGFVARGELVDVGGIPHIDMVRTL